MTRKDYVALAAALAEVKNRDGYAAVPDGIHGDYVTAVADVLAADNPRFDRDRFYKAAGF